MILLVRELYGKWVTLITSVTIKYGSLEFSRESSRCSFKGGRIAIMGTVQAPETKKVRYSRQLGRKHG